MVIVIKSTYSNTFFSLHDQKNNVIAKISAGMVVSDRAQRASYFGGVVAGIEFAKQIQSKFAVRNLTVKINGFGSARDAAIRGLVVGGLKIQNLYDITSNAHNGCRAPKKRRV
jgi:small subunit ribosomal protein S11